MKYCKDCGAELQRLPDTYGGWEHRYKCTRCSLRISVNQDAYATGGSGQGQTFSYEPFKDEPL
jgi:hypothetical protein